MEFNSAFKGLKLLKKTGKEVFNNLNDPALNVLMAQMLFVASTTQFRYCIIVAAELSAFEEKRQSFNFTIDWHGRDVR